MLKTMLECLEWKIKYFAIFCGFWVYFQENFFLISNNQFPFQKNPGTPFPVDIPCTVEDSQLKNIQNPVFSSKAICN